MLKIFISLNQKKFKSPFSNGCDVIVSLECSGTRLSGSELEGAGLGVLKAEKSPSNPPNGKGPSTMGLGFCVAFGLRWMCA
jgi:hypothetical protein